MMLYLMKCELDKAFRSKWFVVSLLVGCAFGAVCALGYIIPLLTSTFTPDPNKFYYPTSQSCYNAWISVDTSSWALLFYQIAPILAITPFAWSLGGELKDGYISQVYVRADRRAYLLAKYCAVFAAAGVAIVVPQLLNLVMLACFFPAYVPSIQVANYFAPVFWQSVGSWLFYNIPLGYVLLYCLIDFALCGTWAGFVMSLSLFVKNRVVLMTAPYLLLLAVQFANERIFLAIDGGVRGIQLSFFENLHGSCAAYIQNGWVILAQVIALFLAAICILAVLGRRDAL